MVVLRFHRRHIGVTTPSMPYAEALRQTRSRADQEAHAPFYVQYEVIEKTFQQSQHADASVFTDMIKRGD